MCLQKLFWELRGRPLLDDVMPRPPHLGLSRFPPTSSPQTGWLTDGRTHWTHTGCQGNVASESRSLCVVWWGGGGCQGEREYERERGLLACRGRSRISYAQEVGAIKIDEGCIRPGQAQLTSHKSWIIIQPSETERCCCRALPIAFVDMFDCSWWLVTPLLLRCNHCQTNCLVRNSPEDCSQCRVSRWRTALCLTQQGCRTGSFLRIYPNLCRLNKEEKYLSILLFQWV